MAHFAALLAAAKNSLGCHMALGGVRSERISVSHRTGFLPENDRLKRTIGDVTRRVCL